MKRPAIIIFLFYLLGILMYEFFMVNIGLIIFLGLIFYILFKFVSKDVFLTCLVFFSLAYFLSYNTSRDEKFIGLKNQNIRGRIESVKALPRSYQYDFRILSLNAKGENIRAILRSKKPFEKGDIIEFKSNIEEVFSRQNFKSFDNRLYMKSKKTFLQLKSNSPIRIGSSKSFKDKLYDFIEASLNKNPYKSREFLKAIILGDKDADIDKDAYRELGLSHILAISGLHLNIIIKGLEYIFANFSIKRRTFDLMIVILLLSYGALVSYPVSILRALIMYAISSYCLHYRQIDDSLSRLFITGLILLIINPFFVYSPGFYFSMAAVYGIYIIGPNLEKIFKIKGKFFIMLGVQLGILPFQLYYYNQFNPLSLIVNTLALPFVGPILILGFISVFISQIFIHFTIESIYLYFRFLIEKLKGFDMVNLYFPSPSLYGFILYYLGMILVFNLSAVLRFIKRNKRRVFLSGLIYLSLLFISILNRPIILNFIDIGQGDGVLIRTGSQNIMIDTGGNPLDYKSSGKELKNYLLKNGIKKIDAVFLSHGDLDHIGNMIYLQDNFFVNKIYYNEIDDKKILNPIRVKKGDVFDYGRLKLEILEDGLGATTSNDGSMVIKAWIDGSIVLFTGDIETREKRLKIKEKIDILKVAHHGSKHSTREDFLKNNRIDMAVISAGKNNRYGHPAKEVLKRLENKGVKTYRTDLSGNIEVEFSKGKYRIRAYRDRIDIWEKIVHILIFNIFSY